VLDLRRGCRLLGRRMGCTRLDFHDEGFIDVDPDVINRLIVLVEDKLTTIGILEHVAPDAIDKQRVADSVHRNRV
jgi:hypothetical protein